MNKTETAVILKCHCGCAMLVAERIEWEDGEVDYNISVQDSRYDHNNATFWGRLKGAAKLLFGKPVHYSDIYLDEPQKFKDFAKQINELCEND